MNVAESIKKASPIGGGHAYRLGAFPYTVNELEGIGLNDPKGHEILKEKFPAAGSVRAHLDILNLKNDKVIVAEVRDGSVCPECKEPSLILFRILVNYALMGDEAMVKKYAYCLNCTRGAELTLF